MSDQVTREEGAGMRWADKYHACGRSSNFMNDMTYQPQLVPFKDALEAMLPPLYRAELLQAMAERGIPDPDRRLTWADFYGFLRKRPDDPYEGTRFKREWEAKNPELKEQLDRAWQEFLASPPPDPFALEGALENWSNIEFPNDIHGGEAGGA